MPRASDSSSLLDYVRVISTPIIIIINGTFSTGEHSYLRKKHKLVFSWAFFYQFVTNKPYY